MDTELQKLVTSLLTSPMHRILVAWIKREVEQHGEAHGVNVAAALVVWLAVHLSHIIYRTYPFQDGDDMRECEILSDIGVALSVRIREELGVIQAHNQRTCDEAAEMLHAVVLRHAAGKLQ